VARGAIGARQSESPRLIIGNRLPQFILGVHDKRAVPRHRLVDGSRSQEQELRGFFAGRDLDGIARK